MTAQITREIATKATNIRNITNQNLAMQELLIQTQVQEVIQSLPLYPKDNISKRMRYKVRRPHLPYMLGQLVLSIEKWDLIFPLIMLLWYPLQPFLIWETIYLQYINQNIGLESLAVFLIVLAQLKRGTGSFSNPQYLKIGHRTWRPETQPRNRCKMRDDEVANQAGPSHHHPDMRLMKTMTQMNTTIL